MHVPAGLSDHLARPMHGVARVVVAHEAKRRFRWLVLLELSLFCLGCMILLPVVALAAVGGGNLDNFDTPDFKGRWHHWWREIAVRFVGPTGEVLAETRASPDTREEADAIVAAVLDAAHRQGVVVVETLFTVGSTGGETRHVYYGGRPLLMSPEIRAESAAAEVLTLAGFLVEPTQELVRVRHALPQTHRFIAWGLLLFLNCLLVPLLVTASGRRWVGDLWADAQGAPPAERVFLIRAESLEVVTRRGAEVRDRQLIDGASLLTVVHGASLSWTRVVRRAPPQLTVVTRSGERTLDVPHESAGPALRDLVLGSTLRLRAERPELGLIGGAPRPTKCPYCTQLYLLALGARCPSCGAPSTL